VDAKNGPRYHIFISPEGNGNCIFHQNLKGWKAKWKQTTKSERREKNITQKLIILHYDYVVHSLTMRFSNWCQRSQSTQTAEMWRKGEEKGEEKKSSRKKSLADGKCISMIFLFSLEVFA
jgi:hypothetical protein